MSKKKVSKESNGPLREERRFLPLPKTGNPVKENGIVKERTGGGYRLVKKVKATE